MNVKRKALNAVTQEIADCLATEMKNSHEAESPDYATIVDELLRQLGTNVVALLREATTSAGLSAADADPRIEAAERRLARLVPKVDEDDEDEDEDEDEIADASSRFPNLKYAKPKYNNVDSVLKLVEHEADKGGIKLVIMNFNG